MFDLAVGTILAISPHPNNRSIAVLLIIVWQEALFIDYISMVVFKNTRFHLGK